MLFFQKKVKHDHPVCKSALEIADAEVSQHETQVDSTPGMIGGLIYEDELDVTTETLHTLAQNPRLIGLKALKAFKTAVHDYWRVANECGLAGNSLISRISSSLIDQRHTDALVFLSEMIIRGQVPKLGALQRWVRECDAVLTPSMSLEEENKVWQVLDAILRTTQPEMISKGDEGKVFKDGSRLRWLEPFCADRDQDTIKKCLHNDNDLEPMLDETLKLLLQPLQTTPGHERRPPNKHPAIIWFSPPSPSSLTFPLALPLPPSSHPSPHVTSIPNIPGALLLSNILTPSECSTLIRLAESTGLTPDEPISGSAAQLSSVLAHNLIWLVSEEFERGLWERVKGLVPPTWSGDVGGTGKAKEGKAIGINKRFRLYRYRPGALYRPHIDGAWPASSLSPTTSSPPSYTYVYDSDPTLYSRLTFLIYLNDNFSGGCTTFFLPSSTPGILEARPVKPTTGSICIFPHGSARGSLLHEASLEFLQALGSGVTEGAKYIIRTEVLYEVDKSERIDAVTKD